MQRYFVPKQNWHEHTVLITDDDAHHIRNVMRNNIDDYIICNHPDGRAARCKIQSLEEDVEVIVVEWLTVTSELPVHVTIAQAIPKGNKIDLILQKGTELGAHDFVLFQADRSIAKWSQTKMKNRLKRFNKIVKEAAEQSHRNQLPKVNGSFTLKDLLDYIQKASYDFSLFAYEEEAKSINYSSFGKVMRKMKQGDKIIIFIGPEGGFTNDEVSLIKQYGGQPIRLGPRILRTETASLYALASISYHFEESGYDE